MMIHQVEYNRLKDENDALRDQNKELKQDFNMLIKNYTKLLLGLVAHYDLNEDGKKDD